MNLLHRMKNFKYVIIICPWLGDKTADDECVLAVDRNIWDMLIKSGEVYFTEEVAGVEKHEED